MPPTDATPPERPRKDERDLAGAVVAGRYRIADLVGRGGASRVFAAEDLVAGGRVAVKLLESGATGASLRVHREISALRLLRLPGVVSLLDEGTHEGTRFLVMDLIEGAAFPGRATPLAWEPLAPLVLPLLEILARVHAAGIVHRDLKPPNVLVGRDGRVTVLDFGISWGPALGSAVTMDGAIVGTPEYLAPEQFLGAAGDARTDLYAVGVMLYESLCGVPPHVATDFSGLVEMRRSRAPVPVRIVAPAVPRRVALVVDQLLAIDPDDRPQSAGEALEAFFGERPLEVAHRTLPRLGPAEPLERLLAGAHAMRSMDVAGPVGSGRSRLLADAAVRLTAEGRDVHWLPPSTAPYGSLAGIVGGLDDLRAASHDEAKSEIERRVAERLRAGTVVVADDAERLDRWSAAALERCRGAGSVLRATVQATDGAVPLGELTEEDLRPLFAGPDRLFHLREDGARELWRRTGGLPARVVAEVAAWARAGIAHWDGSRVAIQREALHRLRGGQTIGDELLMHPGVRNASSTHLDEILAWIAFAWPHGTADLLARATGHPRWTLEPAIEGLVEEGLVRRIGGGVLQPLAVPRALHSWAPETRRQVHRALATALPPGAPMRLRHLAAAGAPEEVVDEALLLAPELTRLGQGADAHVVLDEGLSAARRSGDREREERVLVELVKTCLAERAASAIERALYEIGRAGAVSTGIARAASLLRAAGKVSTGEPERALAILDEVGAFEDLDLELWRQGQRVRAAQRLPPARAEAVLSDVAAWAERTGHPRALASASSWKALHLTRVHRHAEAARLHLEAGARTERVAARMASVLNAGLAFLEGRRFDEARAAAESCRDLARTCRDPYFEAYAESLLRAISYRLGETRGPDRELVEAADTIDDPSLVVPLLLTEAAAAWRAGLRVEAAALAGRSARRAEDAEMRAEHVRAQALLAACSALASPRVAEALADEAASMDDEAAVEVLGLLALAVPERRVEWRSVAAARAAALPREVRSVRGEILSPEEAVHGLDGDER